MDWINRYLWVILVLFRETLVQCFTLGSQNTRNLTPSGYSRSSVFLDPSRSIENPTVSNVFPTSISTIANTTGRTSTSVITVTSSVDQLKPTATKDVALPSTLLPANSSQGVCAQYTGQRCRDVLHQTLTEYNETERYFDKKQGMNKTKQFLGHLLDEVEKLKSGDQRCQWLIKVAICQYTLTPCLPNGNPVMFCREDCERLTKECKVPLAKLIGSASLLIRIQNIDFVHLVLPTNCSSFRSRKLNESCVYLGLFDHSSKTPQPSLTKKIILWSSVGAAILIIVVIAIIVTVSLKWRKSKEKGVETTELDILDMKISTMKARVNRQPSRLSLLSAKVAEMYDPEKLIEISLEKIEYIRDLGEGQFGLVFQGMAFGLEDSQDPTHKTPVAVKTLKTDSYENCKEEFDQEAALMSILEHPNIVKLLGVATEDDPHCMIFEFMELGDLNQFLRKAKPLDGEKQIPENKLSLDDFLKICRQVASGMSYLASLHFVHRDLAARNCLVAKELTVKIADFGLSRDIYSSDYYKVRGDAMLPIRWMPPEALLHGRFTVKSDIYSYGVVMWEVFTYGLQPYYGYSNEEVISFSKEAALLAQPDDCPTHVYNLMTDCWARNPEKRPDFDKIVELIVQIPPPLTYNKLNIERDAMKKTVDNKSPSDSNQTTSNYQTAGTIINVGFAQDDGSETVLPASLSQESAESKT